MDRLTRPKLIKLDYPEGVVGGGGAGITNFIFCFLRPSKFDTVGELVLKAKFSWLTSWKYYS